MLRAVQGALSFGEQKRWAFARARRESLSSAQLQGVYWCGLTWGMSAVELEALDRRLNLPRSVKEPVVDALALSLLEPRLDDPDLNPGGVYELLHGFSQSALAAAELMLLRSNARTNVSSYLHRLRYVRPSLTGNDLRALGVAEGPLLGRILSSLRAARLNGETTTREEELALVRRLVDEAR